MYKVSIKILGRKYNSTGDTVAEALNELKVHNPRGKGVLVVSNGDVSKERILMPTVLQRIFNSSGLTKQVALKQVSTLFNGI